MRITFAFWVALSIAALFFGALESINLSFSVFPYIVFSYLTEFVYILMALFVFLVLSPRIDLSSDSVPKLAIRITRSFIIGLVFAALIYPLFSEQSVISNASIVSGLGVGLILFMGVGFFFRRIDRLGAFLGIPLILSSLLLFYIDYRFYPDQYFGIHKTLLAFSFTFFLVGIWFTYPISKSKGVLFAGRVAIAVGLICSLFGVFANSANRSLYKGISQLGKASSSTADQKEYKAIAGEFYSKNPLKIFGEGSGVSQLKGELADYNIVFVLSETTRASDTFLNDKKVNFTPNLKAFSKKSEVYTDAIAPSSGTFQSVSSIFSMVPPTMAPIDLWSKHWVGELRKDRLSAVELFQKNGWRTAWIGHDFHRFFSHDKIRGFDRGFDYKKLEPETKARQSKKSDIRTAKRAVKYIEKAANEERRFFLFTFFSAPHASYVKHYKKMAFKTQRERYQQEVRFVDEQFGRILKAIKKGGIEKKTIVIFAGDHGEAFGEHRSHHHNNQLYRESVHVPLAVFIPGHQARKNSKPVSLFSLLPSLMLSGPAEMKLAIKGLVKEDLGPLYTAMGSGSLSELIRLKKMLTRVDLPDRVLIFDHVADHILRFEDKAEKVAIPPTDADRELIDRLGRLRATRKRFNKRPTYSPWKRFKKK